MNLIKKILKPSTLTTVGTLGAGSIASEIVNAKVSEMASKNEKTANLASYSPLAGLALGAGVHFTQSGGIKTVGTGMVAQSGAALLKLAANKLNIPLPDGVVPVEGTDEVMLGADVMLSAVNTPTMPAAPSFSSNQSNEMAY